MLRPGGVALLAGPLRRTHPLARALSDAWMLFPAEDEYVAWFERGGLRVDRARARRARLVGPALGPLRRGDRRRQAARGRAAARCRRAAPAAEEPAPRARRCAWRASPPARSPARRSSRSRCGSRSCASCAGPASPLALEQGVDDLALPLALDVLVLDQVRLLAHAEALEHARRRGVARLEAPEDAVGAELVERECEERRGGLRRVAAGRGGRGGRRSRSRPGDARRSPSAGCSRRSARRSRAGPRRG